MIYRVLSAELVEAIHSDLLSPGELSGLARDKSLESTIARVDNRLAYGFLKDHYELAATYAIMIARGHCFNDGNKRTAFRSMGVCLALNGIAVAWHVETIGPLTIQCAQGLIGEADFAAWLRREGTSATSS
jgi:death on curing protein